MEGRSFANRTRPLRVVRRDEWGALPTKDKEKVIIPVKYVFYMNTATDNCFSPMECMRLLQQTQLHHMETRKLGDIRYSFIVGGDGQVYEGRGWNLVPALPFKYAKYQSRGIVVGFMGRHSESNIPPQMLKSSQDLVDLGLERNYISKDYRAVSIFQVQPTKDPGHLETLEEFEES